MFNHIWTKQWTTIILLSSLFLVACSGMNLQDRDILKYDRDNIHPHQTIRRQALPNSEIPTTQEYCDLIRNDAYCSSALPQRLVDFALSCGQSTTSGRQLYSECARSDSGAFCGSLVSIDSVTGTEKYLEGNCSGAITSNSCPTQCRAHLEDFKSKLGCCINAHLNASTSLTTRLSVNYRLWNLCGVPLPAMDCQNHGLTFNVPANTNNCTNEELINGLFATACQPELTQPYLSGLLTDTRCYQINLNYTKDIVNLCSMNPRGEFCFLQILSHEGNRASIYSDYISALNSNCDSEISNISHSDCRPTCRNELVEIKDTLGCCVNYYNRSTDYGNPSDIPSLVYGLWESCGVETPEFCKSTFNLSLNGAASTTYASTAYAVKWAFAWVAFTIVFSIFQCKLVI